VKKTSLSQANSSAARQSLRRSGLLGATVAALLGGAAAQAQSLDVDERVARVIDAFNPYLTLGLAYDSNIYRIDDDAPALGDSRSDQYGVLAAGFESRIEKTQQRFDLNGEISRTMFAEHDELDYTGSRANAVWHWVASEQTRGDAGFRHRRTLRDFANQSRLQPTTDIRMENAIHGSGDFSVVDNWKVGVRGEVADISFSKSERLDLLRTMIGGDVSFISAAGNSIGVDAEYFRGDYDQNPASDFAEYTIGPKLKWKFSARTGVEATVGYTSRDHSDASRQDYDGMTGRVVLRMDDDGRNKVSASVYRDLSNLGDEIAGFAVVTGFKAEPSWKLREGLDLRIVAGYEQRDFQRDPGVDLDPIPINQRDRDDDVYTAGAFVDWKVHRNIKLSFGADMQRRSSTRELQDYEFGRFQVQITGSL
jgi:hypothetical protein